MHLDKRIRTDRSAGYASTRWPKSNANKFAFLLQPKSQIAIWCFHAKQILHFSFKICRASRKRRQRTSILHLTPADTQSYLADQKRPRPKRDEASTTSKKFDFQLFCNLSGYFCFRLNLISSVKPYPFHDFSDLSLHPALVNSSQAGKMLPQYLRTHWPEGWLRGNSWDAKEVNQIFFSGEGGVWLNFRTWSLFEIEI